MKDLGPLCSQFYSFLHYYNSVPSKKSSAQVGEQVNSVLTRNGSIKCYVSLFEENILQQLDAFQTEIPGSLTKLCALKSV